MQPILDHPSVIPIVSIVTILIFVIGFWLGAKKSREGRERELEQLRKELSDEKEKNSKERNEREREYRLADQSLFLRRLQIPRSATPQGPGSARSIDDSPRSRAAQRALLLPKEPGRGRRSSLGRTMSENSSFQNPETTSTQHLDIIKQLN